MKGKEKLSCAASKRPRVPPHGPIEPPPSPRVAFQIDAGVRETVDRLRKAGVDTCESCEGGEGHAYHEPTIVFRGGAGAGWRAVSFCLDGGLPLSELRRVYVFDGTDAVGPYWQLIFRRRPG